MGEGHIEIYGVYENNLKDISVKIPPNCIVTINGVSGSGKSTLVRHVIFEEYLRQQRLREEKDVSFNKLVRPKFISLKNPYPSVFVPQKEPKKSEISTVSTLTGVGDVIKQYLIKKGAIICFTCGCEVDDCASIDTINDYCAALGAGTTARYQIIKNERVSGVQIYNKAKIFGFDKFEIEGSRSYKSLIDLESLTGDHKRSVWAVFDPLNIKDFKALAPQKISIWKSRELVLDFSKETLCPNCFEPYFRKSESLFTTSKLSEYNGACEACDGKGQTNELNLASLFNDKAVSDVFLNIPHNGSAYKYCYIQDSKISRIVKRGGGTLSLKLQEQPGLVREKILEYISPLLLKHRAKPGVSEHIYGSKCLSCSGSGFSRKARSVFLNGSSIDQLLNGNISNLCQIIDDVKLRSVLDAFNNLSLADMSLSRKTTTLSGGELQRLKLIKYLTDELSGQLIIIDEPSKGLSILDVDRVFKFLRGLARENSVILVDHSPDIINRSDYSLRLGPGGGDSGGKVIEELEEPKTFLNKKSNKLDEFIRIDGITYETVKNECVSLPTKSVVTICGVSGSGKSSLVKGIREVVSRSNDLFNKCSYFDQVEVFANRRSSVGSYLGILPRLRELFASSKTSSFFGLTKENFSANTKSGWCPRCFGIGSINDAVKCPSCCGNRLNPLSAAVRFNEKTFGEYTNLSVKDLKKSPLEESFGECFELLERLGLDYLTLNRSIPSLSGGEIQRLKLVKFIADNNIDIKDPEKHCLLILDEPTRGLSGENIRSAFECLYELARLSNTVVLIEHSLDIISASDYCVMMGPGSGDKGGSVMLQGPPEDALSLILKGDRKIVNVPRTVEQIRSPVIPFSDEDKRFQALKEFSKNWDVCVDNVNFVVGGRERMRSLLEKYEVFYFNPFVSNFIDSPFLSISDKKLILEGLKPIFDYEVVLPGKVGDVKSLKANMDLRDAWNLKIKTRDFNLAYEMGLGWISVLQGDSFLDFSTRYIDPSKRVVGHDFQSMGEEQFNFYFGSCQLCNGTGFLPEFPKLLLDATRCVTDPKFYASLDVLISNKRFRKYKESLKRFIDEGLIDGLTEFENFSDAQKVNFLYGIPGHSFVKKNGRPDALEDRLVWSGLLFYIKSNINYFDEGRALEAVSAVVYNSCCSCNGVKYSNSLHGFNVEGKRIWEYVR
jgi:excinuclease ABC subunit A